MSLTVVYLGMLIAIGILMLIDFNSKNGIGQC
jgi:hypothetical protein